uniref:Uncharacterized protein n=2 Tax=viral metagenome TaxID=1070528 RepID=A0A6M3JK18_9ZZZZ
MFEERVKHFGTLDAAKLFSYKEFNLFKEQLMKNKKFRFTWILFPYIIFNRCYSDDYIIRRNIGMK